MTDPTITCPNCRTEIRLTESLAGPLLESTRQQYEQKLADKESEVRKREAAIREQRQAIVKAQDSIEEQVAAKLDAERTAIAEAEAKKARASLADEIAKVAQEKAATEDLLKDREAKLVEARKNELELRQERQLLQEQKEQFELEKQRAIDAERAKIREAAQKDADEQSRLKLAERDKTISDLQIKLQDALRKAEQGSQQLQGEVSELELESLLRQHFAFDEIDPVPKGVHGGDVIHTVRDAAGTVCGVILWESKRTKNWSDGWLPKLRDDQRAAKAQLAILVTVELPKDVSTFRHVDGIWVTSVQCAISLAHALRAGMLEVAAAKRSLDGRHDKMEVLYAYLSGPEFRHRVEGIVEAFMTLREDLEAEKRSTQRMWAKREKQLERAVTQTAGMHGDLSGIIGGSLPRIDKLCVPALEPPSDDPSDTI